MAQLVDQYGRPVKSAELKREHAAPTLAGIRTIWTDTVAGGLTPESLANILSNAAQGDHYNYLTLAEEMEERDLHYRCEISKRVLAVSRLPLSVESFSDSATDVRLADEVRRLIRMPGIRSLLKSLMDAVGKGYSVAEIDWDTSAGQWMPIGFQWRDPRFFQFDQRTRAEIRLRDEMGGIDGLPLPAYKFIRHIPVLKCGIPIRNGIAFIAAWAWMCKGYAIKDWLAFAEVFGMPLRMGRYDAGAAEKDLAVLRMAVANLGSDAAAIFPKSMEIELVEAAKSGSTDFFQRLADYLDTQVSRGILGQTATTAGTPGKLGNEDAQQQVRQDIRDDDAEQLGETLQRDLVKPFIDLNFGPQKDYPCIQLRAVESKDMTAMTDALQKLVPLGLRVEKSVVLDLLGLPDPDRRATPDKLLGVPQPSPTELPPQPAKGKALNFTLPQQPDAADLLAEKLNNDAMTSQEAWLEHIRKLLENAPSLEAFRDGLADLFPTMPATQFGELMAQAMTMGNLVGREEVVAGK